MELGTYASELGLFLETEPRGLNTLEGLDQGWHRAHLSFDWHLHSCPRAHRLEELAPPKLPSACLLVSLSHTGAVPGQPS